MQEVGHPAEISKHRPQMTKTVIRKRHVGRGPSHPPHLSSCHLAISCPTFGGTFPKAFCRVPPMIHSVPRNEKSHGEFGLYGTLSSPRCQIWVSLSNKIYLARRRRLRLLSFLILFLGCVLLTARKAGGRGGVRAQSSRILARVCKQNPPLPAAGSVVPSQHRQMVLQLPARVPLADDIASPPPTEEKCRPRDRRR